MSASDTLTRTGDHGFASRRWRNLLQARLEIPLLLRLLRLPPGCDVLETGCGRGVGLVALAQTRSPASLTGVDTDEGALRLARAECARCPLSVDLLRADVRELPFPDASFDLVLDFGTLYQLQPPGQALAEIARVLRLGGLLAHETRLAQRLAHPARAAPRRLPWELVPELDPARRAALWASRIKRSGPVEQASGERLLA